MALPESKLKHVNLLLLSKNTDGCVLASPGGYHSAGETNGSIVGDKVIVSFLKDRGDLGEIPVARELTLSQ